MSPAWVGGAARATVDATSARPFEPMRVCEIELGRPLRLIAASDPESGRVYGRAAVLVRLHGQPIGRIVLPLGDDGASAAEVAASVGAQLADQIARHLRADGLDETTSLTEAGLPGIDSAPCIAQRRQASDRPATVVITTRDRTRLLEASLTSVLAMDHPAFEVVVVDNAPSDGSTEEMVRSRFAGRAVRYVREDWPGISAARNTGVRLARTEFIAFTDDDVEVDREWLSQLVAGFSVADRVGVVTGLTLAAAIDLPVHGWFEEYGGFGKGFEGRVVDLDRDRPTDDPLFPYAPGRLGSGNNMAFRADVIREIGGFDRCLGVGSPTHSGEDLAAFIQALWAGWKMAYRPTAIVHHHHRDSYEDLRRQVYGYGVGLSACMVSCLSRRPGKMGDFVARLPGGLRYLVSPTSAKNQGRTSGYPRRLALAEVNGLARGPFAYAAARRAAQVRSAAARAPRRDTPRGPAA